MVEQTGSPRSHKNRDLAENVSVSYLGNNGKVHVDLYSASSSTETSNALKRSLVIRDHTLLLATRQR